LFVLVWLIGDICNLLGAVLANLLPTVILLGLYYSMCDMILLGQIYYYKWKRHSLALTLERGERAPLLAASQNEQPSQSSSTSASLFMLRYACATCFVILVGIAASWLSEDTHSAVEPGNLPTAPLWLIQTLGWTSAISYLGARIPQICKLPSRRFSTILIQDSQEFQNQVRGIIACSIFLRDFRQYHLLPFDLC